MSIEFELEVLTLYLQTSNPTHNRLAANTHVATENVYSYLFRRTIL